MTGAYSYQIGGPPVPADVTGFVVIQTGENVIISWDNNSDPGVAGFNVYFSEQSADFGASNLLTEVARATEITTSKIPPGDWTFWIVAKDIAGQTSANPASFDFTVINYNVILYEENYIPSFTSIGSSLFFANLFFYQHWTGKLIPKGTQTCDSYNVLSPPGSSIINLDMAAGGSNDDTTYFLKATFVTVGNCETLPSNEISILVPAGYLPTAFIASADYSSIDPNIWGWNIYVSSSSGNETKQNSDILGISADRLSYIDQVWQMAVTGLIAGSSLPSQNTTGWEVFNTFVPNPQATNIFSPASQTDTLVESNKRAWMSVDRRLGPNETDGPQTLEGVPLYFQNLLYSSSPITTLGSELDNFYIGNISARYIWPYVEINPLPNHVSYINGFTFVVDNNPATTALNNVSISSAGTTINFIDYGLAYHEPPNAQVTPSSGTATGGAATAVTSSNALITLYTSTGAVAGVASLAITGV